MLIAVAASENHLKSKVDLHFGRCRWFCIFDTETGKSEFIENPARTHQEKAGCDAADILINTGVSMAIAGRFGSKVVEIFRNKNIQMLIPEEQQTIHELIHFIK